MPDISLPAKQVAELASHLTKILSLEPPPTTKGRYALARWGIATEAPAAAYGKKMGALIESIAAPGSIKANPGGLSFDFKDDEARVLYTAESEAINTEVVTLAGVRLITHAELGACPITGAQEVLLIKAGALDDIEPA